MISLRPYQIDVIARAQRCQRALVVMPTGSGKGVVGAEIIRRSPDKHHLFSAHRRELIHKARNDLRTLGIQAGTILAGDPRDPMIGVQVASVQTLWSRCYRGREDLPPANIVFVDEAHHCPAQTYRKILESYPDAQVIGLTATPCRRDGRGLGSIFDTLIEGPQVQELIDQGYLVPTKVFAPSQPDLEGVKVRNGDYADNELAARMDRPELVGDIVSHWLRLAEKRKTVVFASSVGHSVHLADEFKRSGIRAAHIDGGTEKAERDEILGELDVGGNVDVVCNCMVLTEGWDQPNVACAVLARPTRSMGLFLQMIGRVLRPFPHKLNALILDHAGAVFAHGFAEDEKEWTLDPDKRATNKAHAGRDLKPSDRVLECSNCGAIREAGKSCRSCGFMPRRPAEYLHVRDGELGELQRNGKVTPQEYTIEEKRDFHAGLVYLCRERGNKIGAAAHRFKAKFGHWPLDREITPKRPSDEVIAWDRHCRIKYAKAISAQRESANG